MGSRLIHKCFVNKDAADMPLKHKLTIVSFSYAYIQNITIFVKKTHILLFNINQKKYIKSDKIQKKRLRYYSIFLNHI